jgi:hypothetical protein
MELNLGKVGATRQSWSRANLRVQILKIKADHPDTDHDAVVRLLAERIRNDDNLLVAAADYVVTNAEDALQAYERRAKNPPASPPPSEQVTLEKKRQIDEKVEQIKAQVLMLNEIMPNGKRMRFCTGTEMVKMGNERSKEGAVWLRIGKKAGTQLVGQALNEEQVRAMFK